MSNEQMLKNMGLEQTLLSHNLCDKNTFTVFLRQCNHRNIKYTYDFKASFALMFNLKGWLVV